MSSACDSCKTSEYIDPKTKEKAPALIFVYPECDLICRHCGAVQKSEANYKYSVDSNIKQSSFSSCKNDGTGRQYSLRISSCEYDPACDLSGYRRAKTYDGYNLVFHANEVIARNSRPLIPEEAVDYLCDAAEQYYRSFKPDEENKNLFGLGFSYTDAQRICELAACKYESDNPYWHKQKPRRGDRETVTPDRLRSYAVRWVQIWKILLGPNYLDPKIHPFCPPVLEAKIRLFVSCMTRCWFEYLKLPRVCTCRRGWCEHKQARKEKYENCDCVKLWCVHNLSSTNCRHALFLRAAMYMLGARTSLRRTVRLEGTKVDDWYRRLWFLWPYLKSQYSTIWSGYHRDTVQLVWPDEPPPKSRLEKNEPKFNSSGFKPRWYEENGNFVEDEREWYLDKKRGRKRKRERSKAYLHSSW